MRKRPSTRPLEVELSNTLRRGLRDALRQAPMKAGTRKRLLAMGLIETVRDRFSQLTPAGRAMLASSPNPPEVVQP